MDRKWTKTNKKDNNMVFLKLYCACSRSLSIIIKKKYDDEMKGQTISIKIVFFFK